MRSSQRKIEHAEAADAAWPDLRRLEVCCSTIGKAVPGFSYGGCNFTVLSCRIDRSPPDTVIRTHRHSYCEVILILSGKGKETSAPWQELLPDMMQVHGPCEPHSWVSSREGMLRLGLTFTVQPAVDVRLPDVWPSDPGLGAAVRGLMAEAQSAAPGRSARLAARLTLLLAPALELFALPEETSAKSPAAAPPAWDIASFIKRFLEDNLGEPLSLEDVAAQFNISVPTLTRRFRAATGGTVMNCLNNLRMRRAADLLREGGLSTKQAAAAVGFADPSYFCRCFRRAFGCSPLQLRLGS